MPRFESLAYTETILAYSANFAYSETLFAYSESLRIIQISPNSPLYGVRAEYFDDFVEV